MNFTEIFVFGIIQLLISLIVFLILISAGKFICSRIKSNYHLKDSKFLNFTEYLPEERFTTFRQEFYLVMILIFVVCIMYTVVGWRKDSISLVFFDIVVSLYLIIKGDITFSSNKFLFFLAVPFSSLSYLIFANDNLVIMYLVHVFVFPYMIMLYYRKFRDYTETNSFGITILLLFAIVFVSFFITIVVEGVYPLESLVMVSNAFTSNGYSVLGHSTAGQVNALILVWSGFVLSGVGTATLVVAIVMKRANEKFDRLEEMVKKNTKD